MAVFCRITYRRIVLYSEVSLVLLFPELHFQFARILDSEETAGKFSAPNYAGTDLSHNSNTAVPI